MKALITLSLAAGLCVAAGCATHHRTI